MTRICRRDRVWRRALLWLSILAFPAVAEETATTPAEIAPAAATQSSDPAPDAQRGQTGTDQGVGDASAIAESSGAPESVQAAEPSAPQEHFDVWEYRVEHNTLLPRKEVEKTVYGFLGPQKTIDDIEKARQALEQRYHDAGFGMVLVDIPEQDVEGGMVRLNVVEAKVSRLRVKGSRYFSLGRIREKVPSLAAGAKPYLPDVQKEIDALDRGSPDRTVTPIIRAGKTPGTVEVDLAVQDQSPLHGDASLNDRFTQDTTRLRLNASLRYDNLWQREHSVSLSYQGTPEDPNEVEVFSGTYVFRLPDSDSSIVIYGVRSNSNVTTLGSLTVVGNGSIVGLRANIPLDRGDGYFHSVSLGGDYKDFGEDTGLQGQPGFRTPINYATLTSEYSGTLSSADSMTQLGLSATIGLSGLVNQETEFRNKRFNANPSFAYLRANVDHTRTLWWDSSAYARFDAQVSDSPIINNEQFTMGGVESVRGYLETQHLADEGFTASLELRTPSLGPKLWNRLQDLKFLAFLDGGLGGIQEPLPNQDTHFALLSAGAGLRLAAWKHINASLFWAWPFLDAGTTEAGNSRFHFDVGYEF